MILFSFFHQELNFIEVLKMADYLKCPLCGSRIVNSTIDKVNLDFLERIIKDGKANASLSLLRIILENTCELMVNANSKNMIESMSITIQQNLQRQVNEALRPIETFSNSLPMLLEKLPVEVQKDSQKIFNEATNRLEEQFAQLRAMVPTFSSIIDALKTVNEGVEEITRREIEDFKQDITDKFRESLQKMGFPEPEQLKLLSQLMPAAIPLLEEIVRFHKVPTEKGKQGEQEIIKQLRDYFPEDDCQLIGGSGDTDILASPRSNGSNLAYKIIIESKKNESGWNRSFIAQTRQHMKLRGERFAILAVSNMPHNSNGFLIEQCPEGVLLVTDRTYFRAAYGSLRASIIALLPFEHKELDFNKLFADQKINEAIKEAFDYCFWVKKVREKTQRIETNIEGIDNDINALDKHLRRTLTELQARINNAINHIVFAENSVLSSPIQVAKGDQLNGK